MNWLKAAIAAMVMISAASAAGGAFAAGDTFRGVTEDGPSRLSETRSLGQVIENAAGPVHIIFVHGMRAEGPGASKTFRGQICKYVDDCQLVSSEPARPLYIGDYPETASLHGEQIWTRAQWEGIGRPFVLRHTYRAAGREIVVDEVNWWPLLFPLKCRFLLVPEARLSGRDRGHLKLCHATGWLTDEQFRNAMATRPLTGGGAVGNALLKQQIMNWGLADAVIALGPMSRYVRATMNAAFADAGARQAKAVAPEFVVISESLGSFAVLDAFAADETGPVGRVLGQTYNLYFFANQFALLELGRVKGISDEATAALQGQPRDPIPSPLEALAVWASKSAPGASRDQRTVPQVIAFSDPSDMLTFYVPKNEPAKVVNLYVRNGTTLVHLLANPIKAHTGHADNKAVLKTVFRGPR